MKMVCDTSALIKFYIDEDGSEIVNRYFQKADEVCVSVLCLPEIFSVLSRLKREKFLSASKLFSLKEVILKDFEDFRITGISDEMIQTSCDLLETYSLKTLDALHLASAVQVRPDIFLSFDRQQVLVARKIGLIVSD